MVTVRQRDGAGYRVAGRPVTPSAPPPRRTGPARGDLQGAPRVGEGSDWPYPSTTVRSTRPSEVDDPRQTMASAETSTCRSTAIWPAAAQLAMGENHFYDI